MTEETMGKRISAHRKRMGLTQDMLAERLGVTAQAVSKWENDLSCPDIAMLPKLAQMFGTSTDALLGVEIPEPVAAEKNPDAHEEAREGWHMEWSAGRRGSMALALWILLTGGLLLFSNMRGILHASFWELLLCSGLVVFGGFSLLRRVSVPRLSITLFGIYATLSALHLLPFVLSKDLLLPLFLLLAGLSLLAESFRRPRKGSIHFSGSGKHTKHNLKTAGEWFRCDTSFGENTRRIDLPRLTSGEATVSFGDLVVDLTPCAEISDGCRLRGDCSFGVLEFRIPESCRVENNISTAFGNVEVKGRCRDDAERVIFLEGSACFGEIKIKYI